LADPGRTPASTVAEDGAARAGLQLRLRARGVRDLDVLRALDVVGRERFLPHAQVHLARRDMAVPAANGGSVPEPWLVGLMVQALAPTKSERVLEIGTGAGYATAIVAQLAGQVVTIDRFAAQAAEAQARFARLSLENVSVLVTDLAALPHDIGRFSRILVQGCLSGVPNALLRCLAPGGVLVSGRVAPEDLARRHIVRAVTGPDGRLREEIICPCRLPYLEMERVA
jgi:protein-L-isoaspartate(D-aspartate) O-methyltransferase